MVNIREKNFTPELVLKGLKHCFLQKIHFCLIWKPDSVSFHQTVKEIKDSFKLIDNYITNDNVKSYFENIYTLKNLNYT